MSCLDQLPQPAAISSLIGRCLRRHGAVFGDAHQMSRSGSTAWPIDSSRRERRRSVLYNGHADDGIGARLPRPQPRATKSPAGGRIQASTLS